jgi:hypothetical protein
MMNCLVVAVALAGVAAAALPRAASLAQGTDAAPVTAPETGTQDGAAAPAQAATSARIKYLHDRLRITPAQEPAWAKVAGVMQENAKVEAPLIKDRVRNGESGNAVANLGSYEKLGEAQLDGLKRFVAAFNALYGGLSDEQKKIADSLFRLGPLSMVGAIPQLAEDLVAPEAAAYAEETAPPPFDGELGAAGYPPAYAYYSPYPAYAYYPYYAPWIWGPPVGLGATFFLARGFHHPPFFAFGRPGLPGGRIGVFHHR